MPVGSLIVGESLVSCTLRPWGELGRKGGKEGRKSSSSSSKNVELTTSPPPLPFLSLLCRSRSRSHSSPSLRHLLRLRYHHRPLSSAAQVSSSRLEGRHRSSRRSSQRWNSLGSRCLRSIRARAHVSQARRRLPSTRWNLRHQGLPIGRLQLVDVGLRTAVRKGRGYQTSFFSVSSKFPSSLLSELSAFLELYLTSPLSISPLSVTSPPRSSSSAETSSLRLTSIPSSSTLDTSSRISPPS